MRSIPEPEERISDFAVKVWRIRSLIGHAIAIVVWSILMTANAIYVWPAWIEPALYILLVVIVLHALYRTFIHPVLLQRTWRFGIDEAQIQLKHGIFNKHHLIVPMTKVQFVNTDQGPILRKYSLSTISIGTIASTHDIPAIPQDAAKDWRDLIIYLANITESDE